MNSSFFKRIKEIGGLKVGLILITYFILLWNFNSVLGIVNKVGAVLTPFAFGFVLAYIINPIILGIRKLFYKITRKEINYVVSMILAYIFIVAFLGILLLLIIPQVWLSVDNIVKEAPMIIESGYKWLETSGSDYIKEISHNQIVVDEVITNITSNLEKISESATVWIGKLANAAIGFTKFVFNCILGLIISIYMLIHKDTYKGQAIKASYAFMQKEKAEKLLKFLSSVHNTFTGFLTAKSLDSLIIGVLCYIGCLILGFKNSLLIALIVGITNIIPYFGPFIGAIPCALVVLMQGPKEMLIFVIFILILQQFDGNILGPKLLSNSMGLTSLWIIFAIIVMTALFGVVGMVIGVPLFTVIYMYIRDIIYDKLRNKGLSVKTDDYVDKDSWKRNKKEKLVDENKDVGEERKE